MSSKLTTVVLEEPYVLAAKARSIWEMKDVIIDKIVLPAIIIVPVLVSFFSLGLILIAIPQLDFLPLALELAVLLSIIPLICVLGGLLLVYAIKAVSVMAMLLSRFLSPTKYPEEEDEEILTNSYRWLFRGTYWIYLSFIGIYILDRLFGDTVVLVIESIPLPSWAFVYIFEDTILSAVRPIAYSLAEFPRVDVFLITIWIVVPCIFYAIGLKRYLAVKSKEVTNISTERKAIYITTAALFSGILTMGIMETL